MHGSQLAHAITPDLVILNMDIRRVFSGCYQHIAQRNPLHGSGVVVVALL